MMKKTILFFASFIAVYIPAVQAEDSPHEFSANVAYTTDYVFRGVTQTDSGAALQGGFDYSYTGFEAVDIYAGTWASNVNFNVCDGITTFCAGGDSADVEVDWYAGLTGSLMDTGVSWDIGGLYYWYPSQSEDDSFGVDYEFWEGYGSLSYTFPVTTLEPTLTGFAAYSPDYFGSDDDSIYWTIDLGLSLPYGFGIAVLYGQLDVDGDKTTGTAAGGTGIDYDHWSIGVSKDISIFTMDLTYHDAEGDGDTLPMDGCGLVGDCDDRLVFTVSASF